MHRFSFAILSSVFVLSACGGGGAGNLKKTAAVDLSCTAKQIEVEELQKARNGSIYEAHGCGRRAEYSVVKKTVTRTSEITEYVPPPPPPKPVVTASPTPAPAPQPAPQQPSGFTDAQRAQFFADFERNRQQRQADQQAFFASAGTRPSSTSTAAAPPPPQPAAPAPAEPARSQSNDQVGWVCITGDYYTCPSVASTTALGGYAKCRMTCMMSGKCSSCVVGEGEKCSRVPSRDSECPK